MTTLEIFLWIMPSVVTVIVFTVSLQWNHRNNKNTYFANQIDNFYERAKVCIKGNESLDEKKRSIENILSGTILTSMFVKLKKYGGKVNIHYINYYFLTILKKKRNSNHAITGVLVDFQNKLDQCQDDKSLTDLLQGMMKNMNYAIKGIELEKFTKISEEE